MAADGTIRVGIGGWTFPPWRGTFYPQGLPHAQELGYAGQRMSAIEINATFYGRQKPASFAKWRDAVPEGFVFAVKASRFTTHRRELAEAGPSIAAFVESGLTALGPKLGPILWQFPPTRRFEPEPIAAFLALLPATQDGLPLRHAIETRHDSFNDPAYVALLRDHGAAHAIIESDKHTLLADVTADFVYARLERNDDAATEGYDSAALEGWATRAQAWAKGQGVQDLPCAAPPAPARPRDVFMFFISGDKVRAPAAAQAFRRRVG